MKAWQVIALVFALLGPAAAQTGLGLAADPLSLLASEAGSHSATQRPGETYRGPGPMTVGYLGAKKQIVLPAGPWVLLAGGDDQSRHAPPVPLAALVFGQFEDGRLKALAAYHFSSKAMPRPVMWQEIESCLGAEAQPDVHAVKRPGYLYRMCGWVAAQRALPQLHLPGWERALAAAARLGAPAPRGGVTVTRAWVDKRDADYLQLRLIDFDTSRHPVASRVAWLEAYVDVMADGFRRRLSVPELEPGAPAPAQTIVLPD